MAQSRVPLMEEPVKSVVTLAAAAFLSLVGPATLARVMEVARRARTLRAA